MFFIQMYALLEGMNLNMDFKRHDDQMTIILTPKATEGGKATISAPLVLTATPQEFETDFFRVVTEPLRKTAGIIANINLYEASMVKDEEKIKLSADQVKKKADKATGAAPAKKEEKPKEPEKPKVKLLPAMNAKNFDNILQGLKMGIGAEYTYNSSVKGKASFTAEQQMRMAEVEQGRVMNGLLTEEEGGQPKVAPTPKTEAAKVMDTLVAQQEEEVETEDNLDEEE